MSTSYTNQAQRWITQMPAHLKREAEARALSQLVRPDGSAMGVGTKLNRLFRFIAAGIKGYSK